MRKFLTLGVMFGAIYLWHFKFWTWEAGGACDPFIYNYLLAQYSVLLCLLLNILYCWNNRLGKVQIFLFAGFVIFELIFNLTGIVLFIKADWSRSGCISQFEKFLSMGVMLVCLILVVLIMVFFVIKFFQLRVQRRMPIPRMNRGVSMRNSQNNLALLQQMYKNPYKEELIKFLNRNPNLDQFKQIPLQTEEEVLIEGFFMRNASELKNELPEVMNEDCDCPICLENFRQKESMVLLSCRHYLHSHCLKDWLRRKMDCPMCKMSVRKMIFCKLSEI